jgi:hypothetical protein
MAFVTYENYRNPHVTVHAVGCSQIGKKGGQHKYDQGGYRHHPTYEIAVEYANRTRLRIILCSFCRPAASGRGFQTAISGRLPEEVSENLALFEGALSRITVNAYERNVAARRKCIEIHGTACCICGFNFGATYGPLAEGYIHVHHIRPLSDIGAKYVVDPAEDLRPVCPNCHAVLHFGDVCRNVEDIRRLVNCNHNSPLTKPKP